MAEPVLDPLLYQAHDAEGAYLEAATNLSLARIRYAEAFALARSQLGAKGTDGQAHQMAIAMTQDEITVLTAELAIAANRAMMDDLYVWRTNPSKEDK
jgi:hypothetical protein